jgi:ribose-phosphate pyrophosphokinase
MVSPDEGHSKVIRKHAEALGIGLKDMVKNRDPRKETVTHEGVIDEVDERICFMMDDMVGTGGTLVSAAEKLHGSGAKAIYVAATHGWFSSNAAERFAQSPVDGIYVTDTIPLSEEVESKLGGKLHVVSSAGIIASGLSHILTDESVSGLYGGENYS